MDIVQVKNVLARVRSDLFLKPNVVGTAVGEKVTANRRTGELAVVVLVRKKEDVPADKAIPGMIDGVKTDVIEVGDLVAQANTMRVRPAPAGVSIGHVNVTAGTLGYFVRNEFDGQVYVLSNNHVLANSNNASVGDAVVQPGTADGGNATNDRLATLYRYPLLGGGSTVDCALALPSAANIVISDLDGFSDVRQVPGWFGHENQGGGPACFDVNGNGRPDLIVFHIDNPGGENHGYYRIGWNLDADGRVTGGWTQPILVPGWFGSENQAGAVAAADLDGDGRPELLVFHIDNPGGENRGYYRVGRRLDVNGSATNGWSSPIAIPGWFGSENQGGAIAVADLNGDGRPELIVFHIDNPGGENHGYYRIGWKLDAQGNVTGGWSQPMLIPGWFGAENQGGGIAVADVNRDGKPELIVTHIDNPDGENSLYYRVGVGIQAGGQVSRWSDPRPVPGWAGASDQGGGITAVELNSDSRIDLIAFHIDNPDGENHGYYRVANGLWPDTTRWANPLRGTAAPTVGARVWKSGRTTELTNGQIVAFHGTVDVNYGAGTGVLRLEDQIIIAPTISQGGDSGSAIVNSQGAAVGLLFAGSDKSTIANDIGNVLHSFAYSDVRQVPGWFGHENEGGNVALHDINGNGQQDLIVFHIDNPAADNHGYYRIGWNVDGNGVVRGGWSAPIQVPGWFGHANQGGGVALADLDGDGRPELIVFHIDNPGGENRGYYRIGWKLDASGNVTGGWSAPIAIPGWFGHENQGGGVAIGDLNGDGRPELLVFHIDNPGGENRGYYRVGWSINNHGEVVGGWSDPIAIPGWFGAENQGGGIAIGHLNGNSRPEMVVFHIDNPGGENRGYYRVLFDLMGNGLPARWFLA